MRLRPDREWHRPAVLRPVTACIDEVQSARGEVEVLVRTTPWFAIIAVWVRRPPHASCGFFVMQLCTERSNGVPVQMPFVASYSDDSCSCQCNGYTFPVLFNSIEGRLVLH